MSTDSPDRRAVPSDYDPDPERFRLARSVLRRHDSPELGDALPRRQLTFDAELAPGALAYARKP